MQVLNNFEISGKIVDVKNRRVYLGRVIVRNGIIEKIIPDDSVSDDRCILPGFIDAHVHVESSMLIPSEFARLAVVHGTVATISDPHEIGNVLGIEGVRYMIDNGKQVPFHFFFGVPSCVPATSFETAGATIDVAQIEALFIENNLKYLSEMMNFPGVLARDSLVMDKIKVAQKMGVPVDGHAPGLRGEEAKRYIEAGISTDHECFMLDEALGKLQHGMKIIIREGSAARNYEALHTLIKSHPEQVMFCSDDKHPHELVEGHINELVKRSINKHGYDTMDVLRCACYNPIVHYKLDVGYLQAGQPADFIVVDNLKDFNVKQTYIEGKLVAENGKTLISSVSSPIVNQFNTSLKKVNDFKIKAEGTKIQVIKAIDGQLITEKVIEEAKIVDGYLESDISRDILKLVVVNRYSNAPLALGFIQGFDLKKGAIASCIAHDSHNIIAVGATDEELCAAVNAIIENKGGIAAVNGNKIEVLSLPVAGIMSHHDGYAVAQAYSKIDKIVKEMGTTLEAPFMTLSFMALLVIPSLKLSDRGLFSGTSFTPLILE